MNRRQFLTGVAAAALVPSLRAVQPMLTFEDYVEQIIAPMVRQVDTGYHWLSVQPEWFQVTWEHEGMGVRVIPPEDFYLQEAAEVSAEAWERL